MLTLTSCTKGGGRRIHWCRPTAVARNAAAPDSSRSNTCGVISTENEFSLRARVIESKFVRGNMMLLQTHNVSVLNYFESQVNGSPTVADDFGLDEQALLQKSTAIYVYAMDLEVSAVT